MRRGALWAPLTLDAAEPGYGKYETTTLTFPPRISRLAVPAPVCFRLRYGNRESRPQLTSQIDLELTRICQVYIGSYPACLEICGAFLWGEGFKELADTPPCCLHHPLAGSAQHRVLNLANIILIGLRSGL